MCEFCDEAQNSMMQYRQWMQEYERIASDRFLANVVSRVQPGVCPLCSEVLGYEDMHPRDAACTRSLCNECYVKFFAAEVTVICPVCGLPLPESKINAQNKGRRGRREVRNHLHEECVSRWAFMHAAVVGVPPQTLQIVYALRNALMQLSAYPMPRNDNMAAPATIIDGVAGGTLPQISPQRNAALPGPTQNRMTVDQLFSHGRDKREEVVHVPLPWKR